MTGKQVFFIQNDLQNLEVFYRKVKENTGFQTELLSYDDCESEYIQALLKKLKPVDLVIVIASGFFKAVAQQLIKKLHSLYSVRFTNIILLYQDLGSFMNLRSEDFDSHSAFYSPEHDLDLQVAYFNQYLLTIFEKAMTQDRLNDYICNSFREVVYSELLAKKNKRIKRLNEELEKKNKIDHLTRLFNREALLDLLDKEIRRTRRTVWRMAHTPLGPIQPEGREQPLVQFPNNPAGDLREHLSHLSLLYVQIEAFGKLNDEYGYLKGDEILLGLAEAFRSPGILRGEDIAGRLGAGNFLVIPCDQCGECP
jgi:GGDEF domain-containing protein